MKKKIIFYQSAAEITQIFKILKKNEYGSCIIVLTGGSHFLEIVKKLKLRQKFGAEIFLFNTVNFFHPINFVKNFFRLYFSNDVRQILSYFYDEAIFFNKCFDFITPLFLNRIKVNRISYIDFYKFKFSKSKKIEIKNIIRKILLKILYLKSSVEISFLDMSFPSYNKGVIYFNLKNRLIKKKSLIKIKFSPPLISMGKKIDDKKKVIYLDSNEEKFLDSAGEYGIGEKIRYIVSDILNLFSARGYQIIIKKHGREKISSKLKKIKNLKYNYGVIPIELYKLNESDFVLGYASSGLSLVYQNNPKVKSISITSMIPSKIIKFKKMNKYFNILQKNNNVFFPKNINEIGKYL